VAQAGRDRLRLLDRQLEPRQPLARLDAEQIRDGGFPFRRRIKTAWISFLARVRARTSCSRRDSRRRSTLVRSSGLQTASSSPPHNSLASVRASSRSVLARACRIPVSFGDTTTTRATCGSKIRATSQALPHTSSATRSSRPRLRANSSSRSGVVSIRPAERSAPASTTATSQNSKCTSNPIALPSLFTSSSSASLNLREKRGQTTPTE